MLGTVVGYGFYTFGNISAKITNITGDFTGPYSGNYAFYAEGDISGIISYVKVNGGIRTDNEFTGKLINCQLDCRGKSISVINKLGAGAIIERCKLLSDDLGAFVYTIDRVGAAVYVQITYTITNYGINGSLLSYLTPFEYNSDFTTAN